MKALFNISITLLSILYILPVSALVENSLKINKTNVLLARQVKLNSKKINAKSDFLGTGKSQILWRSPITGEIHIWENSPNGKFKSIIMQVGNVQARNLPKDWTIEGTGDFLGTGKSQILWRSPITGEIHVWEPNSDGKFKSTILQSLNLPKDWTIEGTGDFLGTGKSQILWRSPITGETHIWETSSNGKFKSTIMQVDNVPTRNLPKDWTIEGTGDFLGTGKAQILWRSPVTGEIHIWETSSNGKFKSTIMQVGNVQARNLPKDWTIEGFKTVMVFENQRDMSQLNNFIAINKGKTVPSAVDGVSFRGQCVSLVTQWQRFIGKPSGYWVEDRNGNVPIPAWNALINGNYNSIVAGERNIDLIRDINNVQPGDVLIINSFSPYYSHTAIAISSKKNGGIEIFESNANNQAPNTSATIGFMTSNKFIGAIRYK
jgi:hypothetical protein